MIETLIKKCIAEPRRSKILAFHKAHLERFNTAWGSRANHQAWEGGYRDHLTQCFDIANQLTMLYGRKRFGEDCPYSVLYFHDLEKLFRYSKPGKEIDKDLWYDKVLPEEFSIRFTDAERNALWYIHGEGDEYTSSKRVMNELAGFCHAVDTLSARVFHDKKRVPRG